MKKNFMISIWMTIVTTVLLGLVYPFVVTGLAQLIFPKQANGELIMKNGQVIGSRLIGPPAGTGSAQLSLLSPTHSASLWWQPWSRSCC